MRAGGAQGRKRLSWELRWYVTARVWWCACESAGAGASLKEARKEGRNEGSPGRALHGGRGRGC